MKKIALLSLFYLSLVLGFAQSASHIVGSEACSHRKSNKVQLVDRSYKSANSPKHTFDVLDYKINIDLVECFTSPYPNYFTADVVIKFRVDSTLNQIVLDANSNSLTIDSVKLNATSFSHDVNLLTVQLDRTYNPGELADIHIFYKHNDVTDYAFYASGGFVFTDCEPEGARKWFPCYDKPSDKATTDITAKVPLQTKLGSNGRLQDSIVDGQNIFYHWISRDPVATYLIVLTGKNNFNLDIVNWQNPNTQEIVPIRFYYNNGEDPSYIKSIIGEMTSFFSSEFGDHPFEKNGFATLNSEFSWGGMENQTLTSLCPGCWGESLIAHEFAHQWFGDMITCATWADIFLNEGFATWTEAFWNESRNGHEAYMNELQSNAEYYKFTNPHWAISTPSWAVNTPGVGTLFNYSITYMKASCVLHMLRYTMTDSAFFPALKAYATDTVNFKHNSSTIEDFKNKMELESNQELDWFFDQWIYKPDHPVYENTYGIYNEGSDLWRVNFIVRQQEQAFLPYFQMPVELKISFENGSDTLIRVFNSFNNQQFEFTFNQKPLLVEFDPENNILLKEGSTQVSTDELERSEISATASPNPFTDKVLIEFQLEKPMLVSAWLYDNTGKQLDMVFEQFLQPSSHTFVIEGKGLPIGIYFVKLTLGNQTQVLKLIHSNG